MYSAPNQPPAPGHPTETAVSGQRSPRIAVYTAITGRYDTLRNPSVITPGVSYFCFTDEPRWLSFINDTAWTIAALPGGQDLDVVRKARWAKILCHRIPQLADFDYSVWIDGNVDLTGDIRRLIASLGEAPLTGFRHPFRNCLYEEGRACILEEKDDPNTIRRQLAQYRSEGYPAHHGLTETNVLIRRHQVPEVVSLMESWWSEVRQHSKRDQLSFCYAAWKTAVAYETLGDSNARGRSEYFATHPEWRIPSHASRLRILLERKFGVRWMPPDLLQRWRPLLETEWFVRMNALLKKLVYALLTVNLGFVLVLVRAGPREALDRLRRSYAEMQPFQRGIYRLSRRGPNMGGACAISAVVTGYCAGKGLEVGPGSRPYCPADRTEYLDRFPDRKEGCVAPDIVADASAIPRPDGCYDFVFSSHTLEHHPDTFKVLLEWKRVLRPAGVLVLVLPHKDRTFDYARPKTPLQHHIEDFENQVGVEDETHLAEWVQVVEERLELHPWTRLAEARNPDGSLNHRWMAEHGKVHYHVWDQDSVVRILQHLDFKILLASEDCSDRSDSFMIVARPSHAVDTLRTPDATIGPMAES